MLEHWKDLRHMPRGMWVLFATTLTNRAGSMVLVFLVLYLTRSLGFSAGRAAFVLLVYGVGAIVAAPLSGLLSDRIGPVRLMRASLFLSGAMLFAYPFAKSYAAVLAVTVVLSAVTEAFRPASMALIADLVSPAQRKAAFALYRLAINLGMSVGPALGGFLATRSFRYLFLVDGGTSLMAGVVLIASASSYVPHARAADGEARFVWPRAHLDGRFVFFLAAMLPVMLIFFQHLSAMSLWVVRDHGLPESTYGLLFSINTLLIVCLEVPLNAATAHWPHRRTLVLGALLSGAGFGAMAFASGVWSFAATVVVWTFGEMFVLPGSAAYLADVATPERRGEYSGLFTMSFSLAFAVGPWAGTLVLDRFGGRVLWVGTFLLGLLAAAMMLRLPEPARHTEAASQEELPDATAP
ncbi:MAG: MDR family MFS transporter [Thermoanaerobaculia bacterium]